MKVQSPQLAPQWKYAEIQQMQLKLVHMGITVQGAQQIVTGEPVTSPSDRQSLAAIVGYTLRTSAVMHKPVT